MRKVDLGESWLRRKLIDEKVDWRDNWWLLTTIDNSLIFCMVDEIHTDGRRDWQTTLVVKLLLQLKTITCGYYVNKDNKKKHIPNKTYLINITHNTNFEISNMIKSSIITQITIRQKLGKHFFISIHIFWRIFVFLTLCL